ncbi:hypothetical protein [Motilimonas sp. KMU-193]|uniref:hypothetical protein n=1 Tax=Motilimonas sp. KMU-193 TaxID=3388668 RepID=UPI00396B45C4
MMIVGSKLSVKPAALIRFGLTGMVSVGWLFSPIAQSGPAVQEYKCALVLTDNQPFIAHFSYESEYESMSKMEQDVLTRANETVFDIDGVTTLSIKHWVECIAKRHDFQKRDAQQIEAQFAQ